MSMTVNTTSFYVFGLKGLQEFKLWCWIHGRKHNMFLRLLVTLYIAFYKLSLEINGMLDYFSSKKPTSDCTLAYTTKHIFPHKPWTNLSPFYHNQESLLSGVLLLLNWNTTVIVFEHVNYLFLDTIFYVLKPYVCIIQTTVWHCVKALLIAQTMKEAIKKVWW